MNSEAIRKQIKHASNAVDLVKMSQRSQHTSIKEAMKKMLRAMSMIVELVGEKSDEVLIKDISNKNIELDKPDLSNILKKAAEIKVDHNAKEAAKGGKK